MAGTGTYQNESGNRLGVIERDVQRLKDVIDGVNGRAGIEQSVRVELSSIRADMQKGVEELKGHAKNNREQEKMDMLAMISRNDASIGRFETDLYYGTNGHPCLTERMRVVEVQTVANTEVCESLDKRFWAILMLLIANLAALVFALVGHKL